MIPLMIFFSGEYEEEDFHIEGFEGNLQQKVRKECFRNPMK